MEGAIAVKEKSAKEIYIEQRKKDGYKVTHKFAGKYSVEEMIARLIRSHT